MTSESQLANYRRNRAAWRDAARLRFITESPQAEELRQGLDEFVVRVSYGISGFDWSNINSGKYLAYLIATFVRTHMIVSDLIAASEIVEAVTLQRKQIETLARLHEIRQPESVSKLLGQVPNVKHLGDTNRTLYGPYSEVAHSAVDSYFYLLGRGENQSAKFMSLFPKFDANAYVTLGYLAVGVTELYVWVVGNLEDLGVPFDSDWARSWWKAHAPSIVAFASETGEELT